MLKIFKTRKKINFVKIKLYASVIGMGATMLLTGCKLSKNNNEFKDRDFSRYTSYSVIDDENNEVLNNNESSIIDNESDSDSSQNVPETVLDEKPNDQIEFTEYENLLLSKEIKLTENLRQIKEEIKNINVDYQYSKLFELDKAVNSYNNINDIEILNNLKIIKNNKVNEEDLYKMVKSNNGYDKNIDDISLTKICNIICEDINYLLENNDLNVSDLDYNLSNLKISSGNGFSYAYYSPSINTLGINLKIIENLAKESSFDTVLKKVIEHEANHMAQSKTSEYKKANSFDELFGMGIKFDNLKVNSLYWEWYIEACAEQLTIDKNNYSTPFTYPQPVKGLEAIKIATVFDNNTEQLEKLSLQHDLSKVYDYFKCTTDKQKEEILNFFYSMNIITNDSYSCTSNDFFDYYNEINGNRIDKTEYNFSLKNSCAITLSKQFYSNLINSMDSKKYSLEQIFHLISIEEDELSRFLWYSKDGYKEKYEVFFEKYTAMQSSFFEQISNELGCDLQELQTMYDIYHSSSDKSQDLGIKNNSFYLNLEVERKNDSRDSIKRIANSISKKNVK